MKAFKDAVAARTPLQVVKAAGTLPEWPVCEACGEHLRKFEPRVGTAYFEPCRCLEKARLARERRSQLLAEIAVTNPVYPRYAKASLAPGECVEDRHNAPALARARAFVCAMFERPDGRDVPGFGLFSAPTTDSNGNGTGKTWIAYGVLRALRAASIPALLYRVDQLDREAKATFREEQKKRDLEERLFSAPVVVIDDLGKQWAKSTGETWVDSLLDSVVNERWLRCLPCIVTTNIIPHELIAHYSANDRLRAVIDRLHGIFAGGREWIELTGESRRLA